MEQWRQIRSYLLDHGLMIPDAETFLKNKSTGFIAMVTKAQYDSIVSNTLMVRDQLNPVLVLLKLKVQRKVLELYQFNWKPGEKLILDCCTIDDNKLFKFDEDTFFIPFIYVSKTDQTQSVTTS